jgi:hypothetical protein
MFFLRQYATRNTSMRKLARARTSTHHVTQSNTMGPAWLFHTYCRACAAWLFRTYCRACTHYHDLSHTHVLLGSSVPTIMHAPAAVIYLKRTCCLALPYLLSRMCCLALPYLLSRMCCLALPYLLSRMCCLALPYLLSRMHPLP